MRSNGMTYVMVNESHMTIRERESAEVNANVVDWLKEHCPGRYVLGMCGIWFSDENEATMAKLLFS